jgi:4-nitrophenyl phosphatase
MSAMPLSAADLLVQSDGLLLDSYGVLVTSAGPLPHAAAFIAHLNDRDFPYAVVTNDASRTPEAISRWYRGMDIAIPAERIVSSGLMVAEYVMRHGLKGAQARVLGPEDSLRMVERSGLRVLAPQARLADAPLDDTHIEVVVLCDEAGYPFLPTLDETLSLVWRRHLRGEKTHLLLPNPDRVYPKGPQSLGVGAGAVASALESALSAALPNHADVHFVRLGKPHAPIFEKARSLLGGSRLVMVGDQLETDVAGAKRAGLRAALIGTGVLKLSQEGMDPIPDFLLESLAL